jgi:hypothetical protein
MDPSIVDSASFGQIWKVAFNNLEKVSNFVSYRHVNTLEMFESVT